MDFPEEVAPGVRLYGPNDDGIFQIADHGGWVPDLFKTREEAIAAAEPCDPSICDCQARAAEELSEELSEIANPEYGDHSESQVKAYGATVEQLLALPDLNEDEDPWWGSLLFVITDEMHEETGYAKIVAIGVDGAGFATHVLGRTFDDLPLPEAPGGTWSDIRFEAILPSRALHLWSKMFAFRLFGKHTARIEVHLRADAERNKTLAAFRDLRVLCADHGEQPQRTLKGDGTIVLSKMQRGGTGVQGPCPICHRPMPIVVTAELDRHHDV